MVDFTVWDIFRNLLLAARWTVLLSLIAFVGGGLVALALLVARLARLRGAIQIAREVPAVVHKQDAVSFVRELEPAEGTVTVLWHSVMWQYLSREDRAAIDDAIGAIGDRATDSSPFAHLFLEPIRLNPDEDHDFHVMLRTWPSGERCWLGTAHPHGIPVLWT